MRNGLKSFHSKDGKHNAGILESMSGTTTGQKNLEEGTRPHEIVAVKARALRFIAGNKVTYAKMVHNPGTTARPFMSTSLAENAEQIRAGFEQAVSGELNSGA